jgi:hypothetical protein
MYKIQKDKYQKSRGGYSRILDVCCEHCGSHIAFYQKDGPGILKRMYVDRFVDNKPASKGLTCGSCSTALGVLINYKKEDRPAYRIFVGAVTKKITKKANL